MADNEPYDWQQRCWIATAPAGVWTSGPVVIWDLGDTGLVANERMVERYRAQGYKVMGPYVLEEESSPSP